MSAKCPACGESIWVPYTSEDRAAGDDAAFEPDNEPAAAGDEPAASEPPPLEPAGEDVFASVPASSPATSRDGPNLESRRRETPQEDINCPNCHAANESTAAVCRFCGTSLEGVVPQPKAEWTPPKFDVGEIMSSTWRLYTQNIGLLIGCMLLVLLIGFLAAILFAVPVAFAAIALQDDAPIVIIPAVIVFIPICIVLGLAFQIGQTNLFLRIARGETASVGDVFFGFKDGRRFIARAFLVSLTAFAAVLVGSVLCCAPAIVVVLVVWPALPILLDTNPPGGEIIGRTIEFIKQDFGAVIAAGAIGIGIQMLAQFVPYVGIILQLFAVPFAQVMLMFAYLRITQQFTAVDRMSGS